MDGKGLDRAALTRLLSGVQDGVASRRQLVELGAREHDIARMVRRRELAVIHPGVYVNHTGELTWKQRAWVAVLVHWPAALARESALPDPKAQDPIHVAIDVRRTVRRLPGIMAHRTPDLASRVDWGKSPPRVRLEHALIDVAASARDPLAAFHTLAEVCRTRRTTAQRVTVVLAARSRVAGKELMLEHLDDLATGACSVLERAYLRDVERRHGLPEGRRQEPATTGTRRAYRDVEYAGFGLVVELDGRAFHDDAASRDHDSERDLEATVDSDLLTVRLTYGQVLRSGCLTADRIGRLLRRRGWTGSTRRCPECLDS